MHIDLLPEYPKLAVPDSNGADKLDLAVVSARWLRKFSW